MNPLPPEAAGTLGALVQCLEDEYQALLAEDGARLESALAQKEELLSRLAGQPGFAAAAGRKERGPAEAPWKRALSRIRALNHRNAIVLAPRLAANRARLRFLQAALGRENVYSADGSVSASALRAGMARSAI